MSKRIDDRKPFDPEVNEQVAASMSPHEFGVRLMREVQLTPSSQFWALVGRTIQQATDWEPEMPEIKGMIDRIAGESRAPSADSASPGSDSAHVYFHDCDELRSPGAIKAFLTAALDMELHAHEVVELCNSSPLLASAGLEVTWLDRGDQQGYHVFPSDTPF